MAGSSKKELVEEVASLEKTVFYQKEIIKLLKGKLERLDANECPPEPQPKMVDGHSNDMKKFKRLLNDPGAVWKMIEGDLSGSFGEQ